MPPAIETRDLTRRYGDLTAVDAVTLQVPRGEVFGFLGPNGAGKSTMVKMLTTQIRVTDGAATVAGHDVHADPLAVRRSIGVLPERMPVYPDMTAREFLRTFARVHGVPRGEREDRIEDLLARVKLQGVEGKPTGEFSKGMTQRLGLARALLHDPDVLFLDEPASGLDPTGQREIRALMRRLADTGKTIFLCTHDLGEAQEVCHRIAFIRGGELVAVRPVRADAMDVRVLTVELDGDAERVAEQVARLEGVRSAQAVTKGLRVRFVGPADRRGIARAVQEAGAVVLGLEESEVRLEDLYKRYVEGDGPTSSKPATFQPVDRGEGSA